MNPSLPRKIAELQAFAVIGLELFERAGETAQAAFPGVAQDMSRVLGEQLSWATPLADQEKAEKTTLKLRGMMERYIGDDWHNPVEILEWSGFYLGAAAMHWSLVEGWLQAGEDTHATYARQQTALFTTWLEASLARIQHLSAST